MFKFLFKTLPLFIRAEFELWLWWREHKKACRMMAKIHEELWLLKYKQEYLALTNETNKTNQTVTEDA